MSVFIVSLRVPNSEVRAKVQEFDNYYIYSNTVFFIATENLSQEVAFKIGLQGDDRVPGSSGVVAKMNGSYSGFTSRDLWDWLETHVPVWY